MITQDAETEDELSRKDLVKGYEFKKDTYVILKDEEFESARLESSTTMKVDKFVDIASIDLIYYDASYLAPDGKAENGLSMRVLLVRAFRRANAPAVQTEP